MPGGWPGLSQTIVAAAERALSELRISDNYADFVRLHVADRLAKEEDVRLDAVARSLDLSSRALQWRLGQSNANYEALLREVRTTTAISLLRDTALTMNEVGRRLGFSEGSAFTRWSRQHFSMTPSAYRRSLRTAGLIATKDRWPRRSSALCRMIAAAILSMTWARRARDVSASSRTRSAAAVVRRSSHNKIGGAGRWLRLRAKARVDCALGPSLPSRLRGRPRTRPAISCSVTIGFEP